MIPVHLPGNYQVNDPEICNRDSSAHGAVTVFMILKHTFQPASAEQQYAPRTAGEILLELINTSNSPFAMGYRKYLAAKEKGGK